MLFYASEVEFEPPPEAKDVRGIHSFHFVGQLLVFLEHARLVLNALNYAGPLALELRLEAIRGVPWITFQDRMAFAGPASQLDDSASFSLESTADELIHRRDALAINLMRFTFYATNLTEAVSDDSLKAYVVGGYEYNTWGRPSHLQV